MINAIVWENNSLKIINQCKLPLIEEILTLSTIEDVEKAIKTLAIRGAPNLGVAALYGTYVGIQNFSGNIDEFDNHLNDITYRISQTRPTAYDLFAALERAKRIASSESTVELKKTAILNEAHSLIKELEEHSQKIAQNSLEIIPKNASILTHCNTGTLAAPGNGTALSVIIAAHEHNKLKMSYADETRPLLQGARLTVWELQKRNIPVKVLSDNTAGMLMKMGIINLIVVGADRIARNFDAANKIGTYSLAILAKYHKIPFYIVAPTNTFDTNLETGEDIIIEQRDSSEVTNIGKCQITPDNTAGINYAFDVTPNELITGIITQDRIIYPSEET